MSRIRYRILVDDPYLDEMWVWGGMNKVGFHFIKKITGMKKYVYDVDMTSETYLIFKLCIPSQEYHAEA